MSVVPLLDGQAARALTERIRETAERLWELLAEAHDGKAWAALGYPTFKGYVEAEFGMSKQRAYQLLDHANVVRAICAAANVESNTFDLTSREVQELKPHLEVVIENVRDATIDTDPELKPEAARAAIEETREAIRGQREIQRLNKTDLGGGLAHPARYTAGLIPLFAEFLEEGWAVLDPFAGTGKIHELRNFINVETVGVEIEKEWADLWEWTFHGDALDLGFPDESFDAIVTSPTYGNRLADHHEAYDPEARRTYRHDLGRPLSENNSGQLQWGAVYRDFHLEAWREATRVLRPGGLFVLNIKDHIRSGKRQAVSAWHATTVLDLGYSLVDCVPFTVTGHRNGSNHLARLDAELVWVFRKGAA